MASNGYPSVPSAGVQHRRRYLTNPLTLSLTDVSSARSAALSPGTTCAVYANCEWYFLQGASDVAATTSSILLEPYEKLDVYSAGDVNEDAHVAGIAVSGTGTAYIVKVS